MGGKYSVNDKPIGKSIYNKIYATKVPVYLGNVSREDEQLIIGEYNNQITLLDPFIDEYRVKLDPGLKFVIKNVEYHWGIDAGNYVKIIVVFIENINTDNIKVLEKSPIDIDSCDDRKNCISIPIQTSENVLLKKLLSHDKKILKLKNREAKLHSYYFQKNNHIDEDIPYQFNDELLEYIGRNHLIDITQSNDDEHINTPNKIYNTYTFWIVLCIFLIIFIHRANS